MPPSELNSKLLILKARQVGTKKSVEEIINFTQRQFDEYYLDLFCFSSKSFELEKLKQFYKENINYYEL